MYKRQLAAIIVMTAYKKLLLEKPVPAAANGKAPTPPPPKPRGNPKKNK